MSIEGKRLRVLRGQAGRKSTTEPLCPHDLCDPPSGVMSGETYKERGDPHGPGEGQFSTQHLHPGVGWGCACASCVHLCDQTGQLSQWTQGEAHLRSPLWDGSLVSATELELDSATRGVTPAGRGRPGEA